MEDEGSTNSLRVTEGRGGAGRRSTRGGTTGGSWTPGGPRVGVRDVPSIAPTTVKSVERETDTGVSKERSGGCDWAILRSVVGFRVVPVSVTVS